MSFDFDDNISLGYCSDVQQFSPDYLITWSDPSGGTYIDFLEQPADYRYRYLKEKYHGNIVGESSPATKKKDMCKFPKLKLNNYSGSAIVRVWLITNELEKPRAHFHKLARKTPKGVLKLEPHDFIASEQNNYEVTLDYLHIVHAVTNDENDINIYRRKKAHIQSAVFDPPQTIGTSTKEEKDEIKQIDKNLSVFYIQVFDEKTHTTICECVSRKIKNLHNAETGALKIVNCSRTFGTCRGGDEVFIFVEKISKDVEVRFFKRDCNKEKVWEAPAIYGPHNVHHQLGIVFRTPKFHQDINKDTQVFFELHRKSDAAVSDPVSFTYKPHEDYKSQDMAKKRPHSPEIMSSEDEYLPSVVTSYGLKRMKEEAMSPDSTTIIKASVDEPLAISICPFDSTSSLLESKYELLDYSSLISRDLDPNVINSINQPDIYPMGENMLGDLSWGDLLSGDAELGFDGVSSSEDIGKDADGEKKDGVVVKVIKELPVSSNEISESYDRGPLTKTNQKTVVHTKKPFHSTKETLSKAICQKKPIHEIIELLKNIEDINDVDYEGNSALHHAAASSAEYLGPLLEKENINKSIRNLWGDDVVLCAARNGNVATMKILLERNFEANVQNSRTGETPLHLAVSDQNYPLVELLLEHGANSLIDNHSNQSAYEYSLNGGIEMRRLIYISIQNMFKKRAADKPNQFSCSAVEHDLVGKLNGLAVST